MESVLFIYVVFLVLVWPCQLFVRLWYRVSDVLDLSLVSKRFGFWPHITHVIVLTFKEIKHLSDYRTVGLSDRRTVGLSDCRIIGRTPYFTYQMKTISFTDVSKTTNPFHNRTATFLQLYKKWWQYHLLSLWVKTRGLICITYLLLTLQSSR